MNEIEMKNAFNTTNVARTIQDKLDAILSQKKAEMKVVTKEYNSAIAKISTDSIPRFNIESQKLNKIRLEKIKVITDKYASEIATLESEMKSSFENFSKKVENNDAWNDIIKRKSVPQILSELEVSDLTEEMMEIKINGELSESAKKSRYGFPIKHLETLGWITRSGSGKSGDALVSHLTTEGKYQLNFYRTCKSFDYSKVV